MKMAAHLSGGKVNVALVQELARKELLRLLGKCDGTKVQKNLPFIRYYRKHIRIACHTRGMGPLGSSVTSLEGKMKS
jgi:hypothetical protein